MYKLKENFEFFNKLRICRTNNLKFVNFAELLRVKNIDIVISIIRKSFLIKVVAS